MRRLWALPATVWWLALCQALLVNGNIILITVNPLIGERLAPGTALSTLPVATQMLGVTLATLPAGRLTADLGRRRTFVIANLIGLAGVVLSLASLLTESFIGYSLGTFAIGASVGAGMLYRFAAVDAAPEQRDRALSLVMAGGVLAALSSPWLATHTRDLFPVPFAGTLLGLGVLYLAALGIVLRLSLPDPVRPGQAVRVPLSAALKRPVLLAAMLSAALGYTVMNLSMTAAPLAMSHQGYPLEAISEVIGLHALAMFAPSFFTGGLIRRLGHARLIVAGATLLALSALCALLAPALYAFGAGLLLLGAGWNLVFVTASAWLTTAHRPEEAPTIQALNDCMVFALVTLSALVAGPLNAWLGWQTLHLWLLVPILALTAAVMRAARLNAS